MLRRLVLPACFVLFALPLLLFLALSVPTGEVPDEVAHIVRMEGLLHGSVIGHRSTRLDTLGNTVPDSGVTANAGLLAAGFTFPPGTPLANRVLTRAQVDGMRRLLWQPEPEFVSVPNTAPYAPLFYAPGALGMALAQAAGTGPWQAILAARCVNALLYVGLGCLALLVARRGQGLLFAALLLPMSLWLAASCNQDGLVIATSVLAAALLGRGTVRSWWGGVLALAAVVLAKPPYLPLVGLVALLPGPRGEVGPGLRVLGATLASVPAVTWFLIAQAYASVPFVRAEAFAPGPYWFGDPDLVLGTIDPALQMQVLLHRPSLVLTLPFQTFHEDRWLLQGIVGILGVLDILLPKWLYSMWVVALCTGCAGAGVAARREPAPGWLAAVAGLGCIGAAILALYVSQYLSWTVTGWATVEGMQGRYFIPLLPFLGAALPVVRTTAAPALGAACGVPAVAAAAAGVAVIPALVLTTYYLR